MYKEGKSEGTEGRSTSSTKQSFTIAGKEYAACTCFRLNGASVEVVVSMLTGGGGNTLPEAGDER